MRLASSPFTQISHSVAVPFSVQLSVAEVSPMLEAVRSVGV